MDLWALILLIITSYLGICLIAYWVQELFLFHPEKLRMNFKFHYDMPFEEHILEGEDGTIIDSLLFPVEGAQQVVFYFKGNSRSIKGWSKFAKDFTSKGFNFYVIDYPGFGKSTGKRTEELIYKNAQIAYNFLKTKFEEKDIILYGRSIGSGFATHIAAHNQPKMVILDGPFYDFLQLARYYTRILPTNWILNYKIPLYQDIPKIGSPIFIIHGNKDWMIPYRYSKKIEALDPTKVKLFTIHGASHNNLPKFDEYHNVLDKILHDKDLYTEFSPK